jgi:hypothetical protein
MEDYSATIEVILGISGGHAESSDVSGGSNHRTNHNDPDPTIWLRDHLLELRPLGPFTVRKTRAGDYVVEHGEDLIGQFPREHDAVNFATLRNDGVKQWEKNVRTFPALTVVSREKTSPPRPGLNSMADGRQQSEIRKGLGIEAGARSERRFNSP